MTHSECIRYLYFTLDKQISWDEFLLLKGENLEEKATNLWNDWNNGVMGYLHNTELIHKLTPIMTYLKSELVIKI